MPAPNLAARRVWMATSGDIPNTESYWQCGIRAGEPGHDLPRNSRSTTKRRLKAHSGSVFLLNYGYIRVNTMIIKSPRSLIRVCGDPDPHRAKHIAAPTPTRRFPDIGDFPETLLKLFNGGAIGKLTLALHKR